jgi:predicted phage terminase large subunit-like protein
LHPQREPLDLLAQIREIQGEYTFTGQYQQAPSPLGGGLIKAQWFKTYTPAELPREFDLIIQSWDTANKSTELSDYSVCTTWGILKDHLYLLYVLRKRLDYPDLRRTVKQQAETYRTRNIVIEDEASGTQLIQDMQADGVHGTTRYEPKMNKIMRMHSASSAIENGFVHIPAQADWLGQYLHEMAVFPNGKYDDQVDSTSQALDWFKNGVWRSGLIELYRQEAERLRNPVASKGQTTHLPWWKPAFGRMW